MLFHTPDEEEDFRNAHRVIQLLLHIENTLTLTDTRVCFWLGGLSSIARLFGLTFRQPFGCFLACHPVLQIEFGY